MRSITNITFIIVPNYFNDVHVRTPVILLKHYKLKFMTMKNDFFLIHAQIYSVKKENSYTLIRYEAPIIRPC